MAARAVVAAGQHDHGARAGACVGLPQDELLADYLPHAEIVRIPQPPPTVPECRDVLDLPFMHLAVVGKAQVLVTGDRDLLAIAAEFARVSSCPIMALDAFCKMDVFAISE
jgi:uncharacterized protein